MNRFLLALFFVLSVMTSVYAHQEPGPVIPTPSDAPNFAPTEAPVSESSAVPTFKPSKMPVFHTHHPSEVPTPVPTEVHKHYYGFTMLVFMVVIVAIIAYFTRRTTPPPTDDDDDNNGVALGNVGGSGESSNFKGGYQSLATDNKA